jgi:L-serine dehydratase
MHMRVADVFKIGIGPSSSHTVGPMRAANHFASEAARIAGICGLRVELFGSLALTGIGHGTDRAVLLGLAGNAPETVDPDASEALLASVSASRTLRFANGHEIAFDPAADIVFQRGTSLPQHPNGMRFSALDATGNVLSSAEYFSIGGGAIEGNGIVPDRSTTDLPLLFDSAAELLALANARGLAFWEVVLANECACAPEDETYAYVDRIWATMDASVERGLHAEGILPGGLNVRRRAARLYAKHRARSGDDGFDAMDYVNVVAMAVNEENAAGGRVVTAPTNGAAGVIPAVIRYFRDNVRGATHDGIRRFLLTAAAIGMLYKRNASISGAEVGCQGEVGVACSMAAAGLIAAMNGTNEQAEHAAEIAMEHNLGMTCDPIGGLVQIPCIERNAIGGVKAINAARMAVNSDEHKVSLDQVIDVMYRTGLDMQSKYKETSLGGLAVSVVEC